MDALDQVQASTGDKSAAYMAWVTKFLAGPDRKCLQDAIVHLMSNTVSATIRPKILSHLIEGLPAMSPDLHDEMAAFFLEKINSSSTRAPY